MRVLVGVDGSDASLDGARSAHALFPDASLTLVGVAHPSTPVTAPLAAGGPAAPIAPTDAVVVEEIEREARKRSLDEMRETLEGALKTLGFKADTRLAEGSPGPVLCNLAGEGFAALVLGLHESGLLKRLVKGSVSHYVVHHAPCPVLVVPPAAAATV